jgi:hypothetical protein
MTPPELQFPVFTIPTSDPTDSIEDIELYFSHDSLTLLARDRRNSRDQVGRLLVDFSGRGWRVTDMIDLGMEAHGLVERLYARLFGVHRIRYELSEELHLTFDEIKDRVRTAIREHPDAWRDDEAVAGEGGRPPRDEQEMLEELLAKVGGAKSILELMAVLDFHGRD